MQPPIKAGDNISEEQRKEIHAGVALAGFGHVKAFAEAKKKSYSRILRMLDGREAVTPEYAKLFNGLIRSTLGRYSATAA